LSINLNHPAPEEGHEEYKMKTKDELNQKIKKLKVVVKEMKQEKLVT
jgi:hypothetical protein